MRGSRASSALRATPARDEQLRHEAEEASLKRALAEAHEARAGYHRRVVTHSPSRAMHEREAETRERAAVTEQELRREAATLRAALVTVRRGGSRGLQPEAAGIEDAAALREAAAATEAAHAREVNELASKLEWYVENQRLIDDVEAELAELREKMAVLQGPRAGRRRGRASRWRGSERPGCVWRRASPRSRRRSTTCRGFSQNDPRLSHRAAAEDVAVRLAPLAAPPVVADLVAAAGPSELEIKEREALVERVATLGEGA